MQIKILRAGLHCSIQDLGRHNFLSQAVPVSGAMDSLSARIANLAIGNGENDALLEFTYGNASFKCETDILMAYAGGGSNLVALGEILPSRRAIFVPAGTVVDLVNSEHGVRTYLSVAGGWDVVEVLGSRSTYLPAGFGGYQGRLLKKGDLLRSCSSLAPSTTSLLGKLRGESLKQASWGIPYNFLRSENANTVRIFAGREITWFEGRSVIDLLAEPFTIDLKSNRMGISLKGPQMERAITKELLSTGVCPGTIQVTGNGEMILLMADCQTTGGYPRIAQVASVDIPLCAQLKPMEEISFSLIDHHEAELLLFQQQAEMKKLSQAIHNKL